MEAALALVESPQHEGVNEVGVAGSEAQEEPRFSKSDPITDSLEPNPEKVKADNLWRAASKLIRGDTIKDADGRTVTGVSKRTAINAVQSLTKSDQVPNAAATWIGTLDEFNQEFAGKMKSPTNVEGFYHNGRPYIIIDQVEHLAHDAKLAKRNGTTVEQEAVKRVLKHEALVHGGWRSLSRHNRIQILAWARTNISDDQRAALELKYEVAYTVTSARRRRTRA